MHRPCAFAAIALVAGTVLGWRINVPPCLLLPVIACLILAAVLLWKKLRVRTVLLFFLLAFGAAVYLGFRAPSPAPDDIRGLLEDGPIDGDLAAVVRHEPAAVRTGDGQVCYRFDADVRSLDGAAVSGRVRLYVRTRGDAPQVESGNTISVHASLYPPPRPTNPGQVDYASYYEARKISARGYVGVRDPLAVLDRARAWWGRRAFHFVRSRILDALNAAFGSGNSDAGALLGALLVGERAALDDETEDLYRKTGTVHFLALSGLHVAIFGFFLYWTLALFPLRRSARIGIVMAGLVLYCLLGGASISLVRATVMGLLYLGAELFWRQRDSLNIIGAAAVVVVLINPLDVFSLGFQLSFVAVLSIVAFGPLYQRLRTSRGYLLLRLQQPEERTGLDRVRAVVNETLVSWSFLSLAAWLGVAPLVAYHFHIVTPFSILLNVIISPAIWGLLVMGILTAAVSLGAPAAAPIMGYAVSLLVGGMHALLRFFAASPFHFYVPNSVLSPVTLPWLVVGYGLLGAVAWRLRRPWVKGRHLGAAALVLASLYLLIPRASGSAPGPSLTVLDVGHGCAFVIRTSGGGAVLYDCGGASSEVGEQVIAPYLWHTGVTSLDAVIISHPDGDHTCGLGDVLERFRTGRVIVSPYFERGPNGLQAARWAELHGVPVKEVSPGEEFSIRGALFRVLAPHCETAFGKPLSNNETSLILRVTDSGASFLLTGDAECLETASLLESGADLRAEVLAVPHHGNANPLMGELLRATGARLAVVSAGRGKVAVAAQLEAAGVEYFLTASHGAVTFIAGENGMRVTTFLPR